MGQHLVDPTCKELKYNQKYEDMFAPEFSIEKVFFVFFFFFSISSFDLVPVENYLQIVLTFSEFHKHFVDFSFQGILS